MPFEWMSFSIKKNASALKDSQALDKLLRLDTDIYSQLGTVAVDRAYGAYRTAYKAFKNEIKQAQATLGKLMVEQQKTIAALQALQGRIQGVDNQLMKDLGDNKKVTDDEAEARFKALIKHLNDFNGDVTELKELEDKIQANFKSLSAFLTRSKRAAE